MAQPALQYDRFLIEQLVRPVVNLYRVTPLAAGETPAGPPVAFVRQKRLAFKEDIRFFSSEDESEELFRIKARRVIDVGGRYDVVDAAGAPIVIEGLWGLAFPTSGAHHFYFAAGPDDENHGLFGYVRTQHL